MADLDLSGQTVLIVDDEAFSRDIIGRLLGGMGQPEIHTAQDGSEALDLVRYLNDLSFIISDFKMPLLDGLLLLRCVRAGEAEIDRATPFAMVTGYSDKGLVKTAIDLDVNAFLIKPVSKNALSKRLENMLKTTADGSWLKTEEHYLRIEVDEGPDAARILRAPSPKRPVARRPAAGGSGAPPLRFRPPIKNPARHKKVLGRLSGLKGKFQESDLALDISAGVNDLIEEVGPNNAQSVVSVFDDLETRGLFKLDDIAGVLNPGSAEDAPESAAGSRHMEIGNQETLCALDALPGGVVLCRDINTVDERLFIKSGIEVTPLICSIISYLDSRGVLGLEKQRDGGISGIYVRRADGGEEGEDAEDSGQTPIAMGARSKTVSINEVSPGAILFHTIYTVDGRMYLPAGSKLTPRITTLLKDLYELGTIATELTIVD